MIPLEAWLRARRAEGRKLLVPYLMGGMSEDWVESLQAAAAAGADALEVGIPFSDPMMDGPVIQRAGVHALDRGATPTRVIDDVAAAGLEVPVAVMTYYNIVARAGERRMAGALASAGVAASILPDLPLEECGPWVAAADEAGVENVLLAAPTTSEERLAAICARSRGFVYAVGLLGVTGERRHLASSAREMAARCKAATDLPVLVGVGISDADQARTVCADADGVVVGSALVRRLLAGAGPEGAAAFVGELRAALDAG